MLVRKAAERDLPDILLIYNQGIEDRIATLEMDMKDMLFMSKWFEQHKGRYAVLVAEIDSNVVGWASINPYSNRCAYDGVGDLSVYIHRDFRGKGIGQRLLQDLEAVGKENGFHKFVLFTFPFNGLGQGLYRKAGFREVGIFRNQGMLDGKFVDVMAMEKLLMD
ncbi:arsinothricin resistance N-acetyltransferase ArsN1 family A [Brevibacillus sp. H7]|uniref:arsinothricin resistance N-acetyltransferase ArsN1 family A n=1 Tax=Brevibacillus sp. H7 TaxID=3349138 RepID=UPI0038262207